MDYGYIYNGNYVNQRKNGITKIGMTMASPSGRRANIEATSGHKFRLSKYIRIANITKEDLLFVESWVRRSMAQVDGLTYDAQSNDHFTFSIEVGRKAEQFARFADLTMQFAVEAMHFMGYPDEVMKIKICK
jgi:hypothetical protein